MIQQLEADGIKLQFGGRVIFGSLSCEKSIRINRIACNEAYKKPGLISYLPQFHFIPNSLSLKDIFKLYALDYTVFEHQFPSFNLPIHQTFRNLSGGEKRLIEIYIIVESTAQFALLDEPFSFLNPIQIESVKSYIQLKKISKGIVITDHLYKHVLEISNTNYVLVNGKTHVMNQFSDIERLGYISIENS